MANVINNNSSNFFQLVKTSKSIDSITDKVTDRMIVTKSGELYFDYSPGLRLKLSGGTESSSINNVKTYLCIEYFPAFGELHEDIVLNYKSLFTTNETEITHVINNSLVFDSVGNYGIIFETYDDLKKCKCKILGIISPSEKENIFEKLDNKIIGKFIIAKQSNAVNIIFDKLDVKTDEITQDYINFTSPDDSVTLDINENTISIKSNLKISSDSNNIAKLVDDGLLVSTYSKDEINALFNDFSATKLDGPYESIVDIPEPYHSGYLYLIGKEKSYNLYIYLNDSLICLGSSSSTSGDFYSKSEIDQKFEDLKNEFKQDLSIRRVDNFQIETITY